MVSDVLESKPHASSSAQTIVAGKLAPRTSMPLRKGAAPNAFAATCTHKTLLRDDAVARALVRQREEELREVRVGPLRAEVRREEPVRRVALGVKRVVVRLEGPRVPSRSAAARDDVDVRLDVGPEGRERASPLTFSPSSQNDRTASAC